MILLLQFFIKSPLLVYHFAMARVYQYFTLSKYFSLSNGTPEPPSAFPKAFLIIVIGSIGVYLI
jgi:hypothetical protein